MSQKWSYNNLEFEVDLQDADFAEKYEQAFERMGRDEKAVQKAGTNSEIIRGYCQLFFHLFDDLYGAGTAEQMFQGRVNVGMCDMAYGAFIDAAKACNEEAARFRESMSSRYKPQQNRQQRRGYNTNGKKG